ncbi:sensor histidine kinase [Limibacterium fermenti]|uniref:sensor histidine kinase n=1 Tax=Limibacterium fermenti TaxID=3229863 RepID=UPI000E8D0E4D|nr:hypothetical protein [Porphyromonadaceae bacterium]HBX46236.1 hypothetical protein [Porphyromonadaceae bacterium]
MKSGKIKLIWSLSITAALFVILLQGYWLYNQYRFALEKSADEVSAQTLSAWDDYKAWRKAKLKTQRENLKAYNTNLNQETYTLYLSDLKKSTTDWTISINTVKNPEKPAIQHSRDSIDDPQKKTEYLLKEINKNLLLTDTITTLQKDSTTKWKEKLFETDSTLSTVFRFKTAENQNLVYDAVDVFLADMNSPFKISDMDSLIQQKTGNTGTRIDTLSLSGDSVLWLPKTIKNLSVISPSVTVVIPYNILKRKIANVNVPLVPARIIKTMAIQIIVSMIFLIVLIVCLSLQIQTISRQQRIGKLRQNFVNTTIHELKRPIQTLKTIVSYLQHSVSGESEMLNNARIETDNLTSYLQKLRDVNQAETMKESLLFSFFDFPALLNDCVENIRRNTEKPLRIERPISHAPLFITADKTVMSNIIINLLENAVKYSGDEATIRFRAENRDNHLFFSISDNGIGIAPSEQSHVFDPFFRSKNAYVTSLPGMGLGLSYVKMAVEAHGGTIEIQSKPNNGTTVTVKIPQQ